MDYVKLGRTGAEVSRLCLGCMTFGVPDRGTHPWTLDEDKSRPIVRRAVELGINFFDTANSYSDGTSEEITGRLLREMTRRDEIVVATKVFFPTTKAGPNAMGLSRKAIFQGIDASLRRLGMDYVDLYQIHRWDDRVPIEETLEALHDVVKAGKARYIGASSMYAWQFATALQVATRHGWTRFVTMQNHVNLLYREEEREMLPLCRAEGIGVHSVEPAGARPADAGLAGADDAGGDRRGRQASVYGRRRRRSRRHRRGRLGRGGARLCRAPRSRWPGSSRSAASPRPSSARRASATSTTRWRPCRSAPHAGGGGDPRSALRPASRVRTPLKGCACRAAGWDGPRFASPWPR